MKAAHSSSSLMALGMLVAALVLGMLFGSGASLNRQGYRPYQEEPTETPTLDPTRFSEPLYTSQEVISASLQVFPEGFQPTNAVARLITAEVLDNWRGVMSPFMEPNAPVWMVGVAANGMTVADALPMLYGESGFAPPRGGTPAAIGAQGIEGMFFAWDANSGSILGRGALMSISGQDFSSISGLAQVTATIVPATLIVVPDDRTPEPSVTP